MSVNLIGRERAKGHHELALQSPHNREEGTQANQEVRWADMQGEGEYDTDKQ